MSLGYLLMRWCSAVFGAEGLNAGANVDAGVGFCYDGSDVVVVAAVALGVDIHVGMSSSTALGMCSAFDAAFGAGAGVRNGLAVDGNVILKVIGNLILDSMGYVGLILILRLIVKLVVKLVVTVEVDAYLEFYNRMYWALRSGSHDYY